MSRALDFKQSECSSLRVIFSELADLVTPHQLAGLHLHLGNECGVLNPP